MRWMKIHIKLDRPNEKQSLALKDHHRNVGYGGARGGGKSWFIRTKAILLCLKWSGIKVMIIRKTYPELTANHIDPLKQQLRIGAKDSPATYNDSKKTITFLNGSKILFRYCDTEKDVDRFQGTEVDVIFFDEATQLSEQQMKKIGACLRGVNNFPKRIYYTCNPGGQGHAYIKRIFIDRKYEPGENPEDYSFIQSLVTDNKALLDKDPNYLRQLESLPEKLKQAWLYGEWDIFEGQFFEEFRDRPEGYKTRQNTHVIEPFDIPDDWYIYLSYDFGYSKPFSFQWWAVDKEDTAYMILEFYGCTGEPDEGVKWIADEQFKKVKEIEETHPLLKGRRIIGRVADPAIWNKSTGESVEECAAKNQIYFQKGDNQRIAGWMQVHHRMAFDKNGYSKLYIFNTCKHAIRTIPLLTYSETIPEDLDTHLEDHIADAMRYFCMMRPIAPRDLEVSKKPLDDPLDMFKAKNIGTDYTYINI